VRGIFYRKGRSTRNAMYDSDEEMFLFDEEVPDHVSEHQVARAKPAIRSMTRKKTSRRQPAERLSSSCPQKPIVGSLPMPALLYDDMPPLDLPSSTPPIHDGANIMSSLFTGTRINRRSGKELPRLSSSCPQWSSPFLRMQKPQDKNEMIAASPNSILSTSSQTALSILQSYSDPRKEKSPRLRAASDVMLPTDSPPVDISLT